MNETWEPALFLDERSQALLEAAVAHVGAMECANRCAHHAPGTRCTDCAHFKPNGYVGCDGYEQEPYRPPRRLKSLAAIAALAVAVALCGCTVANAEPGVDVFDEVSDVTAAHHVEADEQVRWECLGTLAEEAAAELEEDGQYCETQYDAELDDETYCEPACSTWDSADSFYSQGVRDGVDSATETWYPESAGRHWRTDEWHTDDEGYYVTAEGYYVVASNDYPEGTVINTSKGEAMVLDDGTVGGNVDFYVSW